MMPVSQFPRTPMRRHALLWMGSLCVLAACGGGGGADDGSVGATPGAAAFTQGVITGFGSIIVNGVRFDDSSASFSDDNGGRDRSEMRLGMLVEIDSSSIDDSTRSAKASSVRLGSELVGPAKKTGSTTSFTLLDQTVNITATTVFDDDLAGGLSKINDGQLLEVHALYDATTGQYRATRIEKESAATSYKLRGPVSSLSDGAKTFKIGNAVINYAGVAAATLPTNLADGLTVRVRLKTAQENNQWVATSVTSGVRKVEDRTEAHLRGTVTTFSSATSFSVNGMPVDASSASFPDGQAGLAKGAEVEVEGTVANGVLVARKVELEDRHGDDDSHRPELHGKIDSINTDKKTFVLRGVTVSYATLGTTGLSAGTKVEVKGTLAADGVTVNATRIKLED